jgi:hypothetical protein
MVQSPSAALLDLSLSSLTCSNVRRLLAVVCSDELMIAFDQHYLPTTAILRNAQVSLSVSPMQGSSVILDTRVPGLLFSLKEAPYYLQGCFIPTTYHNQPWDHWARLSVGIMGGGIGGLATAISLRRAGHDFIIRYTSVTISLAKLEPQFHACQWHSLVA